MVAPKAAQDKIRRAGAANLRPEIGEDAIVPEPVQRGWRDRGSFRSLSIMAKPTTGGLRVRKIVSKLRGTWEIFLYLCSWMQTLEDA
jgi:hypothetical protein